MFDSALEFVIKYTNCTALTGESTAHITNFSYSDGAVQCHLSFRISGNYTGNVKFYYGLREFYQNNKLYVHSRNDVQLLGNLNEVTGCRPLDRASNFVYAPCGFVANSMFNDSFKLFFHDKHGAAIIVPFTTRGVISDIVRKRKFRNPKLKGNQTLCDAFQLKVGFVETSRSEEQDMKGIGHLQNTMRPPWWQTDLCKLGFGVSGTGIAFENVDFMVWMQTSALPNFRKHYRTLDNEVSE
uniref:CUB domain-containing protein n=1 Tax=Angiostrongylus cantonensis TaxID=6313 RepID=A0A0K0D4L1_ANGCA